MITGTGNVITERLKTKLATRLYLHCLTCMAIKSQRSQMRQTARLTFLREKERFPTGRTNTLLESRQIKISNSWKITKSVKKSLIHLCRYDCTLEVPKWKWERTTRSWSGYISRAVRKVYFQPAVSDYSMSTMISLPMQSRSTKVLYKFSLCLWWDQIGMGSNNDLFVIHQYDGVPSPAPNIRNAPIRISTRSDDVNSRRSGVTKKGIEIAYLDRK